MSDGQELTATQARRTATQANDRPHGAPQHGAGRSPSSGRRRSPTQSAQSAQSTNDGPDGPESAGTPPSGTPSPAPDLRRRASRGAGRRPSGNDQATPGEVALSAQARSAQSGGSAGPGLLRTLQRAGRTTGPGRGPHPSLLDHTSPSSGARSHPAVHNHWGSGFTPGSVPAPAAAEPTAEPAADAEAATAAPATGDEDDGGTMAVDDDDEGAIAAAPQPGPALRSIAIQSRKRKGTPNPTLEGVRNAAGVGDTAAQPGTNAPDAKHAPDRARDISRDLRSRPRWVSGSDEFDAVRVFRKPPVDGETPPFPIPSPLGAPEELLAPPAAGATVLDLQLTDSSAPVGNAHSSPHPGGTQATRRPEPPKPPPLAPLVPGADLYDKRGIQCHLVRTETAPSGDPATRAGRSRLFPSVFDEATIKFEMIEEASATPIFGWGPMVTIESAQSVGKEGCHLNRVCFLAAIARVLAKALGTGS